jgi:serine/threonine-protein kinase
VHRDLKPDNLFLCQTSEGDTVKLLDFGSVKDKGESAKKLTVLGTTIGSPFYMAPEQAQGLDTLDHRADVWALAAIIYESVVGSVPFMGVNGPSILLEILTKDPKAPSQAVQNGKHPVPPTLDRVMTHAFKKQAGQRIGSVGALADAVGAAYGLTGNHGEWARVSEAELSARIGAKLPALMLTVAPTAPATAADSFFGEADALDSFDGSGAQAQHHGGGPGYQQGGYQQGGHQQGGYQQGQGGYPPASQGGYRDVPMGVPKGGNMMLFLAVGGGALVVGILIAIVLVLLK